MDNYLFFEDRACKRAREVAKFLSDKFGNTNTDVGYEDGFTIIVSFPDSSAKFSEVSVSAGKIIESRNVDTKELETCLFDKKSECVHDVAIGYDNVCIFEDENELLGEIHRLREIANKTV